MTVADLRAGAVDRADRQLQHAVGAADERHQAASTAGSDAMDGHHRPRAVALRSGWPTKTASIGKRMNIMWIPLLSGSHRPASGSSEARPIRPMNLPHSEPDGLEPSTQERATRQWPREVASRAWDRHGPPRS